MEWRLHNKEAFVFAGFSQKLALSLTNVGPSQNSHW